jgi:hypothetical protein
MLNDSWADRSRLKKKEEEEEEEEKGEEEEEEKKLCWLSAGKVRWHN